MRGKESLHEETKFSEGKKHVVIWTTFYSRGC